MEFIIDSLVSALMLMKRLDKDLLYIVGVSLKVSVASTLISSVIGVPLGFFISVNNFRGKRVVITVLNTLLALPTVVIGLFVYSVISRRGMLGVLGLLYTQKAISRSSRGWPYLHHPLHP